jgi:sec-independent protein translocase protein TatC
VSIQLVARVERKRDAKLRADGLWDDDIHGDGLDGDDEPDL